MNKLESLRKHLLKAQQQLSKTDLSHTHKLAWLKLEIKRTSAKIEDLVMAGPGKK